ncbi:ankyrin repeat protein, partial [Byssothecium circinans]
DGRYPLHSAVQSTRLDIINLFLTHSPNQDHNLDLNPSDAKARTPLILASSNGHFDIVDVLLHSGAKIDAEDTEGNTALHSASAMGWKKIVSRLLRAGA